MPVQNPYGKRYIKNNVVQDNENNVVTFSSWKNNDDLKQVSLLRNKLYDGFLVDILNHLAKDLNFDYVLRDNSRSYGGLDEKSGNWSGIIGQLVERVCYWMTIMNKNL